MESRLGILTFEQPLYKVQHAKGLELLSLMEEELTGRHPERTTTPAGRPEYADCPIDFNISHAKNLVICTMAEGRTGCDIEQATRKVNLAVADKFFHPEEKTFLSDTENIQESRKRFIMLWVLKEAYIKFHGTSIGTVRETPLFSVIGSKILSQSNESLFYSLYEGGGYMLATAFERKEDRDKLIIRKYSEAPDFTLTAAN